MQYELGKVVKLEENGKIEDFLVVRIIGQSSTLFEREDGSRYVVNESYVEFRNAENKVRFLSLSEETTPAQPGTNPKLKALSTYAWKVAV